MNRPVAYIAKFTLRLRRPIQTVERSFPELRAILAGPPSTRVIVSATPDDRGLISSLAIQCIYSDTGLQQVRYPGTDEIDVYGSGECLHPLNPPWEVACAVVTPMLYILSALTLQAGTYDRIHEHLRTSVDGFCWTTPDGNICQPRRQLFSSVLTPVVPILQRAGERDLTLDDWTKIQQTFGGPSPVIPLWRLIFADAIRELAADGRVAVIYGATALDTGAQAALPPDTKFDMSVLRGDTLKRLSSRKRFQPLRSVRDLRRTDSALYRDLSQLWYTRHGIVHRGQAMLYEANPQESPPVRELDYDDIERLLQAVPRGIRYLEDNPPRSDEAAGGHQQQKGSATG